MKTIETIAEKLNLKVAEIRYRGNGVTVRGFALYSLDKSMHTGTILRLGTDRFPEVIEFEPVWRRAGLRWLVRDNRPDKRNFYELRPHEFKRLL